MWGAFGTQAQARSAFIVHVRVCLINIYVHAPASCKRTHPLKAGVVRIPLTRDTESVYSDTAYIAATTIFVQSLGWNWVNAMFSMAEWRRIHEDKYSKLLFL